jgi:hypothetical protein
MMRLLLVALSLEVGLVLLFVPWSRYWEQNYFAEALPVLRPVVMNHYVRGAVSGLGIVNLVVGIGDLVVLVATHRIGRPVVSVRQTHPAED